jgi:hypothetical protein
VAVGTGSARSRLAHAPLAHVTGLHFGAEDPEVVAGLRTDPIAQDVDRVLASRAGRVADRVCETHQSLIGLARMLQRR